MAGSLRSSSLVPARYQSVFHHIGPRRCGEGERCILFHQKDCRPCRVDTADSRENVLDRLRGEAKRGFVKHQKFRARHQGASDRDHLLLATGERSGGLMASFAQDRKQRIDLLEVAGWRTAAHGCSEFEMFQHGKTGPDLALFRAVRDATPDDPARRLLADFSAFKADRTRGDGIQTGNSAQDGRFARAVRSNQGNGFRFLHDEVDAVQRTGPAISALHSFKLKQGCFRPDMRR